VFIVQFGSACYMTFDISLVETASSQTSPEACASEHLMQALFRPVLRLPLGPLETGVSNKI